MGQINRTGTFRFQAIDAGIDDKESGVVQWVAQLKAIEYYDEETEQWIDWSGYDECEITVYLVLFGKEKQVIFHALQLQKALGWSGADFESLGIEHIGDVKFQGRVEEDTYQGTTRLKVTWVDAYDAEPGRTLQKLDTDKVKKLSAKFAGQLRTLSGGVKPQSVPAQPTKEEAKTATKKKLVEQKARSKVAETKTTKPRPTPPQLPTKKKTGSKEQEKIEKGTAWADCCKARGKSVSDKELENVWHEVVDVVGGEDGEDAVEEKGLWEKVRDKVIAQVNKIPI